MGVHWRDDSKLWTMVCVNLASIMESADLALLPGVYREVGIDLHASPSALGSLTLLRSIVQIFFFPLAAYLSLNHSRANVIVLGAILWAIATFFVAISSNFFQVAISRALNGIGLAIAMPAIQSMIADLTDEENRGWAFGWLHFTGNVGSVFGNFCSIILAGKMLFGIAGWRVSFHLIGFLSLAVALLVYKFAVDPRFSSESTMRDDTSKSNCSSCSSLKETLSDAKRVVRLPTFRAIVAQGVAGNFPWAAMSFIPMWLELMGFSHDVTAVIMVAFILSNSLGGLFGGLMGDILARYLPDAGRIILAQFSSSIGVPLGAILLLVLPDDPSSAMIHGVVFFIMGFLISWCGTATNSPIFAEIVPNNSRTTIYALDRSFETVLSSFAPPLVGILAEHVFGYVSMSTDPDPERKNAAALAKALYTAIGIPFVICCLIYTSLYWTYPKDRDRARTEAVIEQQMKTIFPSKDGYIGVSVDSDGTNVLSKGDSHAVDEGNKRLLNDS